jgi:hypothetical protein
LLQQYAGSELLGRPTDKSITVNIIAPAGMEAYIEYGTSTSNYTKQSATLKSLSGEPIEIILTNLLPNTHYYYKTHYKLTDETNFKTTDEHSFVTQKPIGSTFTFDLQADPHRDGNSDPTVYTNTLQTEANDHQIF